MSEIWEQELHPGQAEVHEPIIRDEDLWAHEMNDEPDEDEGDPYLDEQLRVKENS